MLTQAFLSLLARLPVRNVGLGAVLALASTSTIEYAPSPGDQFVRCQLSTRYLSVILVLFFLGAGSLSACGDDEGNADTTGTVPTEDAGTADTAEPLPDITYPEFGVTARFDLEAARDDDFFAFPYPSDLRLNELGGPDLSSFPDDIGAVVLIQDAIEATETTVKGFSNVAVIYFAFDGELDTATLPEDFWATVEDDASVYLVDITPESPWFGRKMPVTVRYRLDRGRYWAPNTISLQPLYGFPLRADTTYAAVVTTNVMGTSGLPAIGPPEFRAIFEDGAEDTELGAHYAPFIETLGTIGIHPNTVAAATVFTTGAPAAELSRLRTWMYENLPQPETEDVFLAQDGDTYDIYEGTFHMEDFLDGRTPFRNFGEGTLTIAADGEPATREPVELRFALSIPSGEAPAGGWPIVLYSHGTGGDYLSFANGGTARELAYRGIAGFGIDQPLHGARNPTSDDDLNLIVALSISNIVIGRDMLRQHAADLFQATRLLRAGLEIPASISASGEEILTDPDRVAFLGHSQGAQVGALFLPLEPEIRTGVYSEGAGGAAITLMERKENDIDIAAVVATALGLVTDDEPLVEYHPAVGVVIQPLLDPADPLSYARYTFLEPLDGVAHDLLMTEGLQDAATPPRGIEALASASGLPIAEPVVSDVPAMAFQEIPAMTLPVSENLPQRDGVRPTGALIQFPGRNHYLVSRDAGAQYQVFEFLRTGLEGSAVIYPAEDR